MAHPEQCPQCGTPLPTNGPSGVCPRCVLGLGLGPAAGGEPGEPAATAATGGRFVAPKPAELAAYFPQFEILALLGQGGMGAVYRVRQKTLDRIVALKILPLEIGQDPAFAERFSREARALARLAHPNIVTVFDFGNAGGYYYFVMEYVDGVNLRQSLRSGRLTPPEALAIVPQICDALQYAHEEGVVHRDIKPENVLLDKKGRVKIADFGLAKLIGRPAGTFSLTGTGQVVGTPQYMAPEQVERPLAVDHRADIYSLGVVFYELLTGELPLGRFAPPSERAAVSADLDRVVLRALEKEPDRRYQQASQVKTDVESCVHHPGNVSPTESVSNLARVPFAIGGLYLGLAQAKGILRLVGRSLELEFQVTDQLGGMLRSDIKTVRLPLEEIESIDLENRWVAHCLRIHTRQLRPLRDVPGAEAGSVDLHIRRRDRDAAESLVTAVRELGGLPVQPGPSAAPLRSAAAAATFDTGVDVDAVRDRVRWSANALIAVGILSCVTFLPFVLAGAAALFWTDARMVNDGPRRSDRTVTIEMSRPADIPELRPLDRAPKLAERDPSGSPPDFPPAPADAARADSFVQMEIAAAAESAAAAGRAAAELGNRTPVIHVPAEFGLDIFPFAMLLAAGIIALLTIPVGTIIILAGVKMKRLEAYPLATTGAVLSMLPLHPAFPLGLPIGLWALAVLWRRDTRSAFRANRAARRSAAVEMPPVWADQQPLPPKPADLDAARARAEVRTPGTALVVLGVLNLLPLILIPLLVGGGGVPGVFELLILAIPILVGVLQIKAGITMQSGKSYSVALAAAMLSLVPCNLMWLFSLPFGIWALLVLQRPHVQQWFDAQR